MLRLRNKYLQQINSSIENMPITILIGARQTGKTSLLKTQKTNLSVVTFDGQLLETNLLFSKVSDIIATLKIKLNEQIKGLLIIDEFQMINNISPTLKILADNYKQLKILCSGSSSLDIVQRVEESLAGRVRMLNIYSLSFSESILFHDANLFEEYKKYSIKTPTNVISSEIKNKLDEQLIFGGMPRVNLIKNQKEKIQILNDIYKTYLLRDVKSYVKNTDSVGFNKLLRLLALQIGNLVNVNELSRNTGLTYNKCEEYIYLLEQMYIIKLVEPYAVNQRKVIKKMKKVFFLDLGIRNIIAQNFNKPEFRNDNGALFENFVYLELLKKIDSYASINFYRTRDGTEVDFVVNNMLEKISFEVKYKKLQKPIMYKGLTNFNKLENIKKSYVVNIELNTQRENINYIPGILLEKTDN